MHPASPLPPRYFGTKPDGDDIRMMTLTRYPDGTKTANISESRSVPF